MQVHLTLDAAGNAILSDGLHRVVIDRPIVEALGLMTERHAGRPQRGAVEARPLVCYAVAAEATALEGVQPFAGEVADVG